MTRRASLSLPSRERGLKSIWDNVLRTPLHVAPFTGAWIEMRMWSYTLGAHQSLPSRERGLKSLSGHPVLPLTRVAPFTGAWIEIST